MKRIMLCLLTTFIIARPVAAGAPAPVFRLHIIANSDSAADQQIKLAVRDALLEYERGRADNFASATQAEAALMADGETVLDIANGVLRDLGAGYSARLAVGGYDFPDREYAGNFYPAGRYRALRVVLGSGQGKNWWCVMFPPLCILELPGGEIDYDRLGEIEFDSYLIQLIKRIDGGRLWESLSKSSH